MSKQAYLSVCAIVRNEASYIAEWLEFHRLVGVERFFIYDDESTDNTLEIIERHNRGDVVVHPWGFERDAYKSPFACTFDDTPQTTAYNHCIQNHSADAQWCAFIDVDEFLYHTSEDDLRKVFADYELFDAVFISWLIFGRNWHLVRPAGLTIENYVRRGVRGRPAIFGWHGKIVGQLAYLSHFGPHGSHNAVTKRGTPVNPSGHFVEGYRGVPDIDTLRINHYYNRSLEEAAEKVYRDDRNAKPGFQPDWQRLHACDLNDVEDTCITRFLPGLKASLDVTSGFAAEQGRPENSDKAAVVVVAYRINELRLREHFLWNEQVYREAGVRVYVVCDKEYDLPEYAVCIVYPEPMPVLDGREVFSLARAKNCGIKAAIYEGHYGTVISADIDICFTAETLLALSLVRPDEAVVPVYWMADDYPNRDTKGHEDRGAEGVVAMRSGSWVCCHYDPRYVGYGAEDGKLTQDIVTKGLRKRREQRVFHIAHAPESCQTNFGGRTDYHNAELNVWRLDENAAAFANTPNPEIWPCCTPSF